jgi:hypothetical protein|tara:strand:+ start:222 stop:764 length:543 start_codon:yes stop_codon:yes gene_type:complete
MQALELIKKTREYLDYVERHINNVARAWKEIQKKCPNESIIYDDDMFHSLDNEVERHDLSKLSIEEFVQYRERFYPTEGEVDAATLAVGRGSLVSDRSFTEAWENHKNLNPHHWQNWVAIPKVCNRTQVVHCTHMVIDWLAMSYEFGDTPRSYYDKNKEHIKIPEWAHVYVNELFTLIEN